MVSLKFPQIIWAAVFLLSTEVFAQQDWKILKDAETYMERGQYDRALEAFQYITHLRDVPYKSAICVLLSDQIKNQPVDKFLAFQETRGDEPLYYYWLGKIYLKRMNIQDAKLSFDRFLTAKNIQAAAEDRRNEAIGILTTLNESTGEYLIEPFESPLNSKFAEIRGILFDDQKKFLFASDRNSAGAFEIYYTSKGPYGWERPRELAFLTATSLDYLNLLPVRNSFFFYDHNTLDLSSFDDIEGGEVIPFPTNVLSNAWHVYLNKYKNRLIFSQENGENGLDLYESVKLRTTGKWTRPLAISDELNTVYNEDYPFLSADRTRLYFSSDRPGGLGKMDIYYSEYDEVNNRWGQAKNIGAPINSMDNDLDFKMLNDQEGMLSSDRMASRGDLDMFSFRVESPLASGTD